MAKRPLAHEDNAVGNLLSSISAVTLTIPLESGDGALFPTMYQGSATSGGSDTALNSTGIGATGIAIGDIIENATDGSYAVVTSVGANALVTTPLIGGTDNTWDNADVYVVNRCVITVVQFDTDGETILKREKMLIDNRAGDILTVNASGRGYDGSSAQSFDAGDYVYNFTTAASFDGLKQSISDLSKVIDDLDIAVTASLATKLSIVGSEVYAASVVGTDAYAVTLSSAIASYTNGLPVRFKADVANTGNATLNVNAIGAKNIYKNQNVVLANGDIPANGIIDVVYNTSLDAGNGGWEMTSHIANVPPTDTDARRYLATFGHNVLAGMNVAIESDGQAYMTRPTTGEDSISVALTFSTSQNYMTGSKTIALDLTDSIKLFFLKTSTGTPQLDFLRITVDPDAGTYTSNSGGVAVSGSSNISSYDFKMLTATTGIVVYVISGTLYGNILENLDTTPTSGAQRNLGAATSSTACAVEVISATECVAIKHVAATGLVSVKLTISGTTITVGTVSTFLSTANDVYCYSITAMSGLQHLIAYYNDTLNLLYFVIATYDTGTGAYTGIGTPVSTGYDVSNDASWNILKVNDSAFIIAFYASGTYAAMVTTSGTVPTMGAVQSMAGTIFYAHVALVKYGLYHYGVWYGVGSGFIHGHQSQLLEVDTDGFDTLTKIGGLVGSTTNTSNGYFGVKLNDEKLIMFNAYNNSTGDDIISVVTYSNNFEGYIGIVEGDVLSAATEYVVTHGESNTPTGLTAGTRYVPTLSGEYTTLALDYVEAKEIGVALSATSIYVD